MIGEYELALQVGRRGPELDDGNTYVHERSRFAAARGACRGVDGTIPLSFPMRHSLLRPAAGRNGLEGEI